ncbi:hypothetical protein BXZ70DRAFT_1003387 [Cristinia sonorae]|uniref:Uncharacterized protein n=1 Tax=Cristinia sonorae TaxID=1940300 RepID=A0A8K0V234_9AGAR|nr:hypothetical protein BXZ70DRAFT_1003387 [Cristinia sonorae]
MATSESHFTEVHMKFTSIGLKLVSLLINILGIALLSHFVSRRVQLADISSFYGFKDVSFARLCTVATFVDSWCFLFTSILLIHGLGLELNIGVCTAAIAICIGFYATSKLFIFLFLTEKVYIVWSSTERTPRWKSRVYIFCMFLMALYVAIGLHLIWDRRAYFRGSDGVCIIGLKRLGTLLLISYDTFLSLILLSLFLYPLIRARVRNQYLRSICKRAVCATTLMLGTSTTNILVLTIMDGQQQGWVCLACCGSDIIINAAVLFWATSGCSLRPIPPRVTDGQFTPNGAFTGPGVGISGTISGALSRRSTPPPSCPELSIDIDAIDSDSTSSSTATVFSPGGHSLSMDSKPPSSQSPQSPTHSLLWATPTTRPPFQRTESLVPSSESSPDSDSTSASVAPVRASQLSVILEEDEKDGRVMEVEEVEEIDIVGHRGEYLDV